MNKNFYIQLFTSANGPRFRIVSKNKNVICTTEAYSSRQQRDDTVVSLSQYTNLAVIDEDTKEDQKIVEGKLVSVQEELLS